MVQNFTGEKRYVQIKVNDHALIYSLSTLQYSKSRESDEGRMTEFWCTI